MKNVIRPKQQQQQGELDVGKASHPYQCYSRGRFLALFWMLIPVACVLGVSHGLVEPKFVAIVALASALLATLLFAYRWNRHDWRKNRSVLFFSSSPPTSLSPQSSRLSLESFSESTSSEDSILAAIANLFTQAEKEHAARQQQEKEHDKNIDDYGSLTARILPRHYAYNKRKENLSPLQERFAQMASRLRQSIGPNIIDDITYGPLTRATKVITMFDSADNDAMVALDLRLTIPSSPCCNLNKNRQEVHMKLHREAQEPAVRTLERLEISLSRKLRKEEHRLARSRLLSTTALSSSSTMSLGNKTNGSDSTRRTRGGRSRRRQWEQQQKNHHLHHQQQQQQLEQEQAPRPNSTTSCDIPEGMVPPPTRTLLLGRHTSGGNQKMSYRQTSTGTRGSIDSCSSLCSSSKAWSTIWVRYDEGQELFSNDDLVVPKGDDCIDDDEDDSDGFRLLPVEQKDSATLWDEVARYQDKCIHLHLRGTTGQRSSNQNTSSTQVDDFEEDEEEEDESHAPIILPIYSCPPTILDVQTYEQFAACVFVGVPLVIETTVVYATKAMIIWFAFDDDDVDEGGDDDEVTYVPVCYDSPIYTPRERDIGKRLSVLIIPMRPDHLGDGYEEAYCFQQKVQALPSLPLIFPLRQEWTKSRMMNDKNSNKPIRVMTYNLLADSYTSQDLDQQDMYNHCPVEYLDRKRRMPLLLYEIRTLQPDIVCLQEVDANCFEQLLRPCLESCEANYQGYYSNKATVQSEGCAMFWSLGRFRFSKSGEYASYSVRDLFSEKEDHNDEWTFCMQGIHRLLDENPQLAIVAKEKVGQVLQVAELKLLSDDASTNQCDPENSSSGRIVVGNTHLFYHPMADHLRVIQSYMICRKLDAVRRRLPHSAGSEAGSAYRGDNGSPSCPLIFCGDFNSYPLSGTIQLLLQGSVGPEHRETWKHLKDYHWEMGQHDFLLEHGFIGNDIDDSPAYEDEEFEDALQEETMSRVSDYESGDDDDDDYGQEGISTSPLVDMSTTTHYTSRRRSSSDRVPTISLPNVFPRLVSGYKEMPEFTNYAVDFAETLDYILVSSNSNCTPPPSSSSSSSQTMEASNDLPTLIPRRSAPMPSSAWMKKNGPMPNENMPSDHVSLVCDLDWVTMD